MQKCTNYEVLRKCNKVLLSMPTYKTGLSLILTTWIFDSYVTEVRWKYPFSFMTMSIFLGVKRL